MSATSDNKRIAKNTVLLYLRTIVVLAISLYTSRVLLKALGVEDLGIYNVVGGIVALLAFFQNAQSLATSRFITYELGAKGGNEKLRRVFTVSLSIHLIIAAIVMILGESVGLYMLENWTEIPIERQEAAFWVFQCSLLVFCLHLFRVPFGAVVIAHENMSIFAYFSIVETILKLGAVLLLLTCMSDRLVLYAVLLVAIALVTLLWHVWYVYSRYPAYKGWPKWNKQTAGNILSFSGWTLMGSSANVATQQGVSLLFNNFVGLVANAAMGFTQQVNAAVGQFVSSFTTAFNPQVIKLYAQKDYTKLHLLMYRASKFSFVLAYVMALPLIVNMDFILHLWLDEVPRYTTEFCQLILVCTTIDATTGVYNTTMTATGKIRNYQFCIACSFLFDLLCAFILLELGFHPAIVFGSRILTRGFINMYIGLYFIRKNVSFNVLNYAKLVLFPITITIIVSLLCVMAVENIFTHWQKLLLTTLLSVLSISICTWFCLFNKSERVAIISAIRKRFSSK